MQLRRAFSDSAPCITYRALARNGADSQALLGSSDVLSGKSDTSKMQVRSYEAQELNATATTAVKIEHKNARMYYNYNMRRPLSIIFRTLHHQNNKDDEKYMIFH